MVQLINERCTMKDDVDRKRFKEKYATFYKYPMRWTRTGLMRVLAGYLCSMTGLRLR